MPAYAPPPPQQTQDDVVATILNAIQGVGNQVSDLRVVVADTRSDVSHFRDKLDRLVTKVDELEAVKAARIEVQSAEARLNEKIEIITHELAKIDERVDSIGKQTAEIANVKKQVSSMSYVVERLDALRWQFLGASATVVAGAGGIFYLLNHGLKLPW